MQINSIGWRTDLHLRRLEGAQVSDHGNFLVVRKDDNPGFRWGNFLLLSAAAAERDARGWVERFAELLPGCGHVAIGLESPEGELGAFAQAAALGLSSEVNAVLVAESLSAAGRRAPAADMRPLAGEDDWRRAVAVRWADDDGSEGPAYAEFVEQQMAVARRVCDRGEGAWFGAFRDGEMLAGLGIFRAGDGLARFQSVDTLASHRRQGLASHLLVAAAAYAAEQLGARRLVIVADPGYHAIDVYRSLGFREVARQAQLERVAQPPAP